MTRSQLEIERSGQPLTCGLSSRGELSASVDE